jgi:hypothetical protein
MANIEVRRGVVKARSSPEQIAEDLRAHVAAGARHFVLDFSVPTPSGMAEYMERFAAEVRPHVREE